MRMYRSQTEPEREGGPQDMVLLEPDDEISRRKYEYIESKKSEERALFMQQQALGTPILEISVEKPLNNPQNACLTTIECEECEVVDDKAEERESLTQLAKATFPHLDEWVIEGAVEAYLSGTLQLD